MRLLPEKEYKEIVKNTPLISIDLIIENTEGKILLGYRLNKPAQNTWFVPGGVIRKNERFTDAFKRISETELGFIIDSHEVKFMGVYEHIYPDNFTNDSSFGTHYIVQAFRFKIHQKIIKIPKAQHSKYWWATQKELLKNDQVHLNTKNYFNNYKPLNKS